MSASEPPSQPPTGAGSTPAAAGGATSPSAGSGAGSAPVAAAPGEPTKPATGAAAPVGGGSSTAGQYPKPPANPLHGWKASLEHTGVPRSVLTWKPKLPSRNWSIFIGLVGSITYLYYEDRRQCRKIREEYIKKVEYLAQQPMSGSLDLPRKVTVYGARWPEDDESDRGLRYFRRYVKPYLVAAAIDYEQVHAPLYGSVARIVRGDILRRRREELGLQQRPDVELGIPPQVAAQQALSEEQRKLDGGVILIGRPSLKEYLAGLRAGWGHGVGEWVWEKDVEGAIENDGIFDEPVLKDAEIQVDAEPEMPPAPVNPPQKAGVFGALSRHSAPPPALQPTPSSNTPAPIPEHLHAPPSPLPPHPPLLLVPWSNHLGFFQIPWMIYDFFTERYKVRSGAEAAYALIQNEYRPFHADGANLESDLDFGVDQERFYKKAFYKLPDRTEKARKDYYKELAPRIEAARQFARGERDLTDDEKRSEKPVTTEDDLRAERRKRELRWFGNLEGWEIVKPSTPIAWENSWNGWLRVFDGSHER